MPCNSLKFQQLGKFLLPGSFFQAYARKREAAFVSFLKVLRYFAKNSEDADLSISLTRDICVIGTFIQVKTQAIFSEERLFLGMCIC